MLLDMPQLLKSLANLRPVFHSEADFQHALAWHIHSSFPALDVRLEYPLPGDVDQHMDIVVWDNQETVTIELKYKTDILMTSIGGEAFVLRSHRAQDCGRYDYLCDVQRLETWAANSKSHSTTGYAVFITNDPSYWNPPTRSRTPVDNAFRLHEGRTVCGTMQWSQGASQGTVRNRESPIILNRSYILRWVDYAQVTPFTPPNLGPIKMHTYFRYLMTQV